MWRTMVYRGDPILYLLMVLRWRLGVVTRRKLYNGRFLAEIFSPKICQNCPVLWVWGSGVWKSFDFYCNSRESASINGATLSRALWCTSKAPPKEMVAQKIKFLVQFRTTSRFDREYRQENGFANCDLSHTFLLNLVAFGPQTAKNMTRVSTHSKSTFSDAYISGTTGHGPLKISHLVDDDQRLHTISGFWQLKFENWP